MRDRILTLGITTTIGCIIGLLAFASLTGFNGYSYAYCDDFSFITPAQAHGEEVISPDEQRITDLQQLRSVLESYKVQEGTYPLHPEPIAAHEIVGITFSAQDPCSDINTSYQYEYRSDATGNTFVIRTLLSDTGYRYIHAQHKEALEGNLLNWWCGGDIHKRSICFGPN